jgi:hypothetical protein
MFKIIESIKDMLNTQPHHLPHHHQWDFTNKILNYERIRIFR